MPVALRCPCGNLSFSLAAAPQPVPTPPGFPTAIKRFGRAELTVAGANWVWEVLIETKSATPEWRVTRCLNCSTDCYAQRAGTQELLVNAELRPRDETPGADGGLHWSAALGVAVEANPDVSNSLLEAPEVMDDRAVELFQALQRTVESHVGAHTAAVHERIRAFEEEQREALSAYTINAYRDRKVLWHNICRALARRHALPASPSPPQPAAPAAVSAAAAAISTSAPTAPATPAPAPAPVAPSLAVLTDRSSPGPASAAVAEWLRASSSAAPLVALVHDADSPRIVRAPTASAAAPAAPSPSLPSVAPASSAIAPAPAPTPTPVAAPTPTAAAALSDASASQPLRLPSPRPRGGYGGQAQLSRPMQVAASAPVRSALSEEGDVFRLEEDEAPAEPLAPAPDDDEERTELPPLRSRAAYREPPPALGGAEALFGTSVPISIPPPRAPPSATPATAAPAGAAGEAADMSLDVPLSSTRRMKGYL